MNTPWFNRTPTLRELIDLIEKSDLSEAEQAELREAIDKRLTGNARAI